MNTGVESRQTSFDDEVESAWERFEQRLSRTLASLGDDQFGVGPTSGYDDELAPYVWFVGHDDSVRVELCSDSLLELPLAPDVTERRGVVALGWAEPDDDEPHYWCDVHRDDLELVVGMVLGLLRHVFGVVHPRYLDDGELWPNPTQRARQLRGQEEDSDGDGCELVIGFPKRREHLVQMVRSALEEVYGDDLDPDEDGEFVLPDGRLSVWVRVHDVEPAVVVTSPLVGSVRFVGQARTEVGLLNRREDLATFAFYDGAVFAEQVLPAVPFVGSQLQWVVQWFVERLPEVAADTAARVGGRPWQETGV